MVSVLEGPQRFLPRASLGVQAAYVFITLQWKNWTLLAEITVIIQATALCIATRDSRQQDNVCSVKPCASIGALWVTNWAQTRKRKLGSYGGPWGACRMCSNASSRELAWPWGQWSHREFLHPSSSLLQHSCLVRKIPRPGQHGGLPSTGSQRVDKTERVHTQQPSANVCWGNEWMRCWPTDALWLLNCPLCVCTPPLPSQTFILNQQSHSCAIEKPHSQTQSAKRGGSKPATLHLGCTWASFGDVWKSQCSHSNLRPAEIRNLQSQDQGIGTRPVRTMGPRGRGGWGTQKTPLSQNLSKFSSASSILSFALAVRYPREVLYCETLAVLHSLGADSADRKEGLMMGLSNLYIFRIWGREGMSHVSGIGNTWNNKTMPKLVPYSPASWPPARVCLGLCLLPGSYSP